MFNNKSGGSTNIKINMTNVCPHCFIKIIPQIVSKTAYDEKLKSNVAILFICPSCSRFFVNEFKPHTVFSNSIAGYDSDLITYSYKQMVKYDLPEELSGISPLFKDIYIQSLTSEAEGLSHISGIGFRKSIEFLLKDFLINYQNEDCEKIAKLSLSQAINKLESKKVKDLARASVWLGNDETHYQRKYEDKDINDMKRFIRALAYFISSELTASEADDFVNE